MNQRETILALMLATKRWLSLPELAHRTGFLQTSISAQLRHLRKKEHGAYLLEKRRSLDTPKRRIWEYRLTDPNQRCRICRHQAHHHRPECKKRLSLTRWCRCTRFA